MFRLISGLQKISGIFSPKADVDLSSSDATRDADLPTVEPGLDPLPAAPSVLQPQYVTLVVVRDPVNTRPGAQTLVDIVRNGIGGMPTKRSDEDPDDGLNNFEVIVQAESSFGSNLGDKYRNAVQPMLMMEGSVYDDHELVAMGDAIRWRHRLLRYNCSTHSRSVTQSMTP